jgi:phosphatidylserine/phosphatidylglycerophosphate/cardiolipin synthase-like enzyme
MLRAAARGANVQVLLDRNRMPNQATAGELLRDGGGRIEVRWYPTGQGASSPRLLAVRHRNDLWMNFGSANFTRRNLGDLNLESSVELRMPARAGTARAVNDYFAKIWSSADRETVYAQESPAAYWRYRFAEATGLSSF